jgi:hypothetical protein
LKDNCHFVFDFSLRDLLRGMLLRMRLAVTVLTRKSAIFVFCSSGRGTSAHAQRHRLIKPTAIFFFFSGRWRDLQRGMLLRMRLTVTVLTGNPPFCF